MNVKFVSLLAVGALSLSGCVTTSDETKVKECYVNFNESGSVVTGKNYTSFFHLNGSKKESAFQSVSKYLASDQWYLLYSNEEEGLIKASKQVSFTNRGTPLEILISSDENTKVSISYSTDFGIYTPSSSLQADFCHMADYISSNSL